MASLLKGYLRELPEPVIPFERYDALLEAAKISQRDDNCKTTEVDSCSKSREEAKKMIKEQLNLLPQPNFDLLRYQLAWEGVKISGLWVGVLPIGIPRL